MERNVKVYHDGENWIATPVMHGYKLYNEDEKGLPWVAHEGILVKDKPSWRDLSKGPEPDDSEPIKKKKQRIPRDAEMEQFILEGYNCSFNRDKIIEYVRTRFFEVFGSIDAVPGAEYVEQELIRFLRNRHNRIKRYKHKVWGNTWNYFVTLTYDDSKWSNPDDFETTLRQTLNSFHTRHGWKYIGVWERGEEGGRKHFHAIAYIPVDGMVGTLYQDKHWFSKKHAWEYFQNNTYFQERFGKAHFEAIEQEDLKDGRLVNYLLKYIIKTNDRLMYSRGVPAETYVIMDPELESVMPYRAKDGRYRFLLPQNWGNRTAAESGFFVSLAVTLAERAMIFEAGAA